MGRIAITAALMTALTISAFAVETKVWQQRTYADFTAGELEGVSVSSKGEVRLSFKLERIGDLNENFVWCIAQDKEGNLYLGTGNEGRVYKVTPEGKAELFFDSPEVGILSLEVGPDGSVYAGTSPDGIIFKISPDGTPTTLFSSGEKYVWDIEIDGEGNVYAATGTNGKIFKVGPDGKGEVLFDSEETNIMCLLLKGDTLYAGGEGNGIIYAISLKDGKVSVVYDASEREIHCIAVDGEGNIYAAATTGAPPQPGGPPERGEERRSALYMISPSGAVRKIWDSPEPLILSLAIDLEGRVVVGTGDSGKLFRVSPDGEYEMIAKCEEAQVLSILPSINALYLATGNPGALYRMAYERVEKGTITSKVFDAKIASRWGKLVWLADLPQGTSVRIEARSGNTSKPDKTWSDWVEGSPPPSRFVQWRAVLETTDPKLTPVLKNVWVTYLQENMPPEIRKISIDGDDSQAGQRKGGPQLGREGPGGKGPGEGKKSVRTIKWQAKDPNGDKLIFSVWIKGVNEKNWRLLKEKLEESSYKLDSTALPDGWYHVKVVATDERSNPEGMAKAVEKISDPFLVDNSQPRISELKVEPLPQGDGVRITFKASDPTSILKSASYSLDNKEWQVMFPDDQLFDSKEESFTITLKGLSPGEHTISVKVVDIAGNISSVRRAFSR